LIISRKKFRIANTIALILVSAGIYIFVDVFYQLKRHMDGVPVVIRNLAELDQLTSIPFPSDTLFFGGNYRTGWHYTIVAKVRIRREEIAPLVKRIDLDDQSCTSRDPGCGASMHEFAILPKSISQLPDWDIESVHSYEYVSPLPMKLPKHYSSGVGSILIDLDQPKSAYIYVFFDGD
jgi:hypothetical protein